VLLPDDIQRLLTRRFRNRHRDWFDGVGAWPVSLTLDAPNEHEAVSDPAAARHWVEAWNKVSGLPGEITWESKQWRRLGTQRLPVRLALLSAQDVAAWAGETARWERACQRRSKLTEHWPALGHPGILSRQFDVLADYADVDFERLIKLIDWLIAHPSSGLFPRQLPIQGLDTKWMEARRSLIADLMRALRAASEEIAIKQTASEVPDFYDLCGVLCPPPRVRIRILCPELRKLSGGLCDLEAPVTELAGLPIQPCKILVLENLETGLALPDIPGTVAVLKLGNAVPLLANLGWATGTRCVYWGDIDTHGFAILDLARATLPRVKSVLMDESTLLAYRSLCTLEPSQYGANDLTRLTEWERRVYQGLKAQIWGTNLRLEQERIPWQHALQSVSEALAEDAAAQGQ
jgi:hypothetical protein